MAVAAAVALVVAGIVLAFLSERSYQEQKIREVSVEGDILASTVTAALAFNDHNAALEYVNALRANPEIQSAAIYEADGALFASFTRTPGGTLPETAKPEPPHFGHDQVTVTVDVRQNGTVLGTVYIQSTTEPFARRLERYGVIVLLVSMAALVLGVLGVAQAELRRANAELAERARALVDANEKLEAQIAERERVEEALRHSQKMEAVGQLSGGIAHDFNNFLAVIMGNLQLIQRRVAAGRIDVNRQISLAIEGVKRASNLTQRILAFSRRQPLSPKPVDLSRLTAEMGELLRHSVGESVAIATRLESDWWTLCDPSQMENVILNLAINARDAMPKGGQLTIETADMTITAPSEAFPGVALGDYVMLTVVDTGVGMSEEVRNKAIDPFFTTKPPGRGTGLGLSMVYGFVRQSNGYLQIDSELGKGTCVKVVLPRHYRDDVLEEAPAGPEGAAASGPAGAMSAPARTPAILIVEDQDLLRTLAVETMRDEGYTVFEEGDGAAALEVLGRNREIDLLISDIRLPGLNGFELTEAATARRPDLRVLLMTGFTQDPVPDELAKRGIEILHKPFNLGDLVGRVNAILKTTGEAVGE